MTTQITHPKGETAVNSAAVEKKFGDVQIKTAQEIARLMSDKDQNEQN